MDSTRRRDLYKLLALVALAFGSIAALLTNFGTPYMLQVVFIVWAVLFLAVVVVFRRKS